MKKNGVKKEEEQGTLKAVGQFFYGENFNEPAFVVARGMNGFKVDKRTLHDICLQKKVQSVRWMANFTPKKSGAYQFTIHPNLFTHILIDGENAKEQEVQLEAGKRYKFMVAYFENPMLEQEELFQLDVHYTFNQQEKKEIEAETFSIPEIVSLEAFSKEAMPINMQDEKPMLDTDNDGIYDEWEVNGYTVINHVVYPWKDDYAAQGYKKYVSNPNESHTAGDPYSDLEKASGALDRSIKKVAWDPLVAAYPSITVGMEELVLSDNKEVSSTAGRSVSRSTSSSASDSNTLGIDAHLEASLFTGVSASITGHYSHTSTHTVDSSNTSGQDWRNQLGLSTAHSAYMNANVRYYNTGTAPVYNLVPTTNLVLGKETIATVTGQLNQKAMSIAPGQTYPKKHLHGLALNTLDQFSTTPISLNINQLDRLEAGEKLKLETTQFQGAFARRDPAGGQVVMEENEWADYMPQIENVTAGILINIDGRRVIERRIAARDPHNPNDLTPELTLEQALEKSVGATYNDTEKNWYFVDEETDEKHILSSDLVHFVYDKRTEKLIKEERDKNSPEDIYKMKIRPGMNIQIDVPTLYDDFAEKSDRWEGGEYDNTNALNKGKCYKIPKMSTGEYSDFSLESNSIYLIMMTVKGSDIEKKVTVQIEGVVGAKEIGVFEVSKDYKNEMVKLQTFGELETSLKLTIKNGSNDSVYIDNFSIVRVGRGIDNLKGENADYAKGTKDKKFKFLLKDLQRHITNLEGKAVIYKGAQNLQQEFYLDYDKSCGAFYITDFTDSFNVKVLTWDTKTSELIFTKNQEALHQHWFLRKSLGDQIGYNIISYADRSFGLDFNYENPADKTPIKIEKLDESKSTQYFLVTPPLV
ncbi:peptidase [Brevibacillus laterosporus]|nr:binary toxin-like calcium binding domain-containing protein [Brevibacillus laterosporus]TPG70130.1 peptidase [Brevibacillus laterosporus]